MSLKARVTVKLKSGVLDPQGATIHRVARGMGFNAILDVKVGKVFEVDFPHSNDVEKAKHDLRLLAQSLLANTVMEDFEIEILPREGMTAGQLRLEQEKLEIMKWKERRHGRDDR